MTETQNKKILKEELGDALALYQWCFSQICFPEYDYRGHRIGLVLGFQPLHDEAIAGHIRSRGTRCRAEDVARWRETLEKQAAIACLKKQDNEHVIFVIDSDKFPGERIEYLPWFAAEAVQRALTVRYSGELTRALLSAIKQAFRSEGTDRLSSVRLVSILKATGDMQWAGLTPRSLGWALRKIDRNVHPTSTRIGGRVVKGYKLEVFREAFRHHLAEAQI